LKHKGVVIAKEKAGLTKARPAAYFVALIMVFGNVVKIFDLFFFQDQDFVYQIFRDASFVPNRIIILFELWE
jgi:hypothetical protein